MSDIAIPQGAERIIEGLRASGHEAYAVGGCVRDSLLGMQPKDWDICTSALPDETKNYCKNNGIRTIDTGIKHGTVTVNLEEDGLFEVTTFRIDGEYTDMRHPDSVIFTDNITKDLSRRDFTINAMALNKNKLEDPFGGREDLKRRLVRCVGNPDDRFSEDALRILRALRFASTYGFDIEEETAKSIHRNKHRLEYIAAERVRDELCKLLCGKGVLDILLEYGDVMAQIIPELAPCIGFEQNSRYHRYTVYEHIAHAVDGYKGEDISIKIALLLHDIGKPLCYSEDWKGGHFHGHPAASKQLAEAVVERLRFDNRTKRDVLELVLQHDNDIEPTEKAVLKWLKRLGADVLHRVCEVRIADIRAQADIDNEARIGKCRAVQTVITEVLSKKRCFSIKDMAINGDDIISLGVPKGKRIGEILNALLDKVIEGRAENEREALLCEVRKMI